tara:strand:- start:5275 stop:6156 length:882 start_codon:yes stop_codon:yes gene_type:complete
MRYSLDDFSKIFLESSVLSLDVKMNIDKLTKQLGIDVNEVRKKKQRNDNWEKVRQPVDFKPTVLNEKTGVDKLLSKIKSSLNKLCFQNYETEKVVILELIESVKKDDDTSHNDKILAIFIDLACVNIIYANFYVKLLQEIFNKYSDLNETFIKYDIIQKYTLSLDDIEYIDSEEDFNKYCLINKNNDKRKGLCSFIVELVNQQVYDEDNLYQIFQHLISMLQKNEDNKDFLHINDEIIDNISTLLTAGFDTMKEQSYYINIKDTIVEYKTKRILGISNRSTFKFMDMCDKCLD